MRHRERIEVAKDGEEITVWNFLNVSPAYQFRGSNPTMETFHSKTEITSGGGFRDVEYITSWVAEELWHELSLSEQTLNETHGIEVVDIESDEVTVL